MKTLLPRLFKCRLVQAGGLLAIIAAFAASIAWSRPPEARVKLGGAWVGQIGGIQWISTHSPLDPDGKTAVGRLQWLALSAEMQGLLATFGADRVSEASGTYEMIGKNTAQYTLIWYGVESGTPSTTAPVADKIKAINVITGIWHFTGPDSAESQEIYKVYLPDGNPEHNVLPAPGATPVVNMTFGPHPQYRIPML